MTETHRDETPEIKGREDIDELKYLIHLGTAWFYDNVVDNPEEEAQLVWESCFYTQMFHTLDDADFTADSLTSASFDPDAVEWLDYAVELGIKDFERNLEIHPTEIADLTRPLEELRASHNRIQAQADAITAHAIATFDYDTYNR